MDRHIWIAGLILFAATAFAQMPTDLMLVDATPGHSFNSPLAVRNANDGSGRLFVIEKCGTIRIVKNGVVNATPFLSLNVACNSEQGLLGLAFSPQYSSNGIFYVTYTDPVGAIGSSHDQVLAPSPYRVIRISPTQPEPLFCVCLISPTITTAVIFILA